MAGSIQAAASSAAGNVGTLTLQRKMGPRGDDADAHVPAAAAARLHLLHAAGVAPSISANTSTPAKFPAVVGGTGGPSPPGAAPSPKEATAGPAADAAPVSRAARAGAATAGRAKRPAATPSTPFQPAPAASGSAAHPSDNAEEPEPQPGQPNARVARPGDSLREGRPACTAAPEGAVHPEAPQPGSDLWQQRGYESRAKHGWTQLLAHITDNDKPPLQRQNQGAANNSASGSAAEEARKQSVPPKPAVPAAHRGQSVSSGTAPGKPPSLRLTPSPAARLTPSPQRQAQHLYPQLHPQLHPHPHPHQHPGRMPGQSPPMGVGMGYMHQQQGKPMPGYQYIANLDGSVGPMSSAKYISAGTQTSYSQTAFGPGMASQMFSHYSPPHDYGVGVGMGGTGSASAYTPGMMLMPQVPIKTDQHHSDVRMMRKPGGHGTSQHRGDMAMDHGGERKGSLSSPSPTYVESGGHPAHHAVGVGVGVGYAPPDMMKRGYPQHAPTYSQHLPHQAGGQRIALVQQHPGNMPLPPHGHAPQMQPETNPQTRALTPHLTPQVGGAENGKTHSCVYCIKSFVSKSKLQRHERIHTGQKPWQCTLCDLAYVPLPNELLPKDSLRSLALSLSLSLALHPQVCPTHKQASCVRACAHVCVLVLCVGWF